MDKTTSKLYCIKLNNASLSEQLVWSFTKSINSN